MLSARGLVLFCLSSWKLDGNEKAHDSLRRYCEYISLHGYQGGATAALKELDGLDKGNDAAWAKQTFARYVQDQTALVEYMLPGMIGRV